MKDSLYHKQLRSLIDSAKTLLGRININYNSPIGPNTRQLLEISKQIIPIIRTDYPYIAENLDTSITKIINRQLTMYPPGYVDLVNAYSYGDIRTTIKFLDILFPARIEHQGRKIFISHSSQDKDVVDAFVEKILMLGCGFKSSDIFCTLNHTSIRTGDDFRNEIIKNMKDCDFILCMISENYRKSEVCQNEMGAAWTLEGKRILPLKFPNLEFSEIGFLNVVKQAADITDKSKLDELYNELCGYYELQPDWVNFNRQKEAFIEIL